MSEDTSGPAFPEIGNVAHNSDWSNESGMTLRQYAAIKLQVPDSGVEWLDGMIRSAKLNDLAKHAMAALVVTRHPDHSGQDGAEVLSQDAYAIASEMLVASQS